MAKFRLNLDDVSVESFATSSLDTHAHGTVRGLQSGLHFTCDPGGCLGTFGCDTAYCSPSQELVCPTATCAVECTANCTTPGPTWAHTCPVTCHAGDGCDSGMPTCPN